MAKLLGKKATLLCSSYCCIVLVIIYSSAVSAQQGCWQTGCQPNDWKEQGCSDDREERGKEACEDNRGVKGFKYNCCPKSESGGSNPPPSNGDFVTFDQFSNAVVTSNARYPKPTQSQYKYFNKYGRSMGKISTVQEAAMALAQFLHETDGFIAMREYACAETQCPGSYRTEGCDAPGQYYYGRGYIQLSWCYNYKPASQSIFGDDRLVKDPDMVAREDKVAWQTAFWFWATNVHDRSGVQEGRFGVSTRAINGGEECDKPGHSGPNERFRIYGNVRKAFGLHGSGDSSGCR